ncbi:MAG TPA: DUF1963 domain-containing protein [Pseudonocardiaceae bacterium]
MVSFEERVAARLDELRVPCVAITVRRGTAPALAVDSYLAGHPYLPAGVGWPADANGPMAFVGQVNLAEVPAGSGWPPGGLLQWFVGTDDTYGLTFDETQGAVGFVARWYAEPAADAGSPPPDAPLPTGGYFPLELNGPTALGFEAAPDLPGWDDLLEDVQEERLWSELAEANGESPDESRFAYEEYARRGSPGCKLGGFPTFTQSDPRGRDAYAPANTPAGRLLMQLDSGQTGGWGDAGVAQLFGDVRAVTAGDLTGVRYHWDCL